jgi:hypothetical protein
VRVRALIEHGTAADVAEGRPVLLSEVDTDGDTVGGQPSGCASVEEAKALAEESAGGQITQWRDAPVDWQPDAITVSNYYTEDGWNR